MEWGKSLPHETRMWVHIPPSLTCIFYLLFINLAYEFCLFYYFCTAYYIHNNDCIF